jgi:hypothetical protein
MIFFPCTVGVFRSGVDWEALRDVPSASWLPVQSASEADIYRRFTQYCDFFTSTSSWEPLLPCRARAGHSLCLLQAEHDQFVFFDEGKSLFQEMSEAISRASSRPFLNDAGDDSDQVLDSVDENSSTESVRTTEKPQSGVALGIADFVGSLKAVDEDDKPQMTSRFVRMIGGHVTGFLRAPCLLPNAVLTSLSVH